MAFEDLDRSVIETLGVVGARSSWDVPDPVLTEFLESLRDGIIVVGSDRLVKYMNASFRALFELPRGQLCVGDDLVTAFTVLASAGMLGPAPGQSIEEQVRRRVSSWGSEETRLERRRLPNGRVLDIYRTETVVGDSIAVCVDVTDSDRSAREIERQRLYMASLLENTTDGITLLDANARFRIFNTPFLKLYDIDADAVHWGISYDDMVAAMGDMKDLSVRQRREEIQRRREFAFDPETTTVRRPLANGRTLNINKTNLPGGGCVMTMRDITEDIGREEALEAARREAEESSRHKSEFVARMSHEMRTPLNGILGVAALMERAELGDRERDLVDVITKSGKVLLRLIDDILDLSRIDADTFDVVEERVELSHLLSECLGLVSPSIDPTQLQLKLTGNADQIPPLRGDIVRIKQILLNLLTNAVKFTERGQVELGVDFTEGPEGVTVTFTIADTGVGIAEDKLDQIFERFYQIDGTVTRRHGGAGLGLSITQKLVDMMGGTIQVASRLGEGTTFQVRLTFQRCRRGMQNTD
ncbi:MAG: PAS-domain containing protein [Pseudomonadota bacterium]